jgi:hypothetical protein
MTEWTKQDITRFQKLYLKHYNKRLNKEKAGVIITSLVDLISLSIEVRSSQRKDPHGNLYELD